MTAEQDRLELIALFREEASEHVSTLNEGVLALERGARAGALDAMFRSAHSLKGSARMLGFHEAERIAHALEDRLAVLRSGSENLGRATVDEILRSVDDLAASIRTACRTARRSAEDAEDAEPQPLIDAARLPDAQSLDTPPVDVAQTAELAERARPSSVRVTTDQLDRILRDVGQLIAEKATATQRLAKVSELLLLAEQVLATRSNERLNELVGRLRQFAAETEWEEALTAQTVTSLEADVLAARMLPFFSVTDPLARVVRDVARRTEKSVTLRCSGGEQVVDRHVLELVKDPLLHLVRNAVDHGVETPAERLRAGKPEEAELSVEGRVHGSRFIVRVADDGRGIDPSDVRRAAERRGLRELVVLESMPDGEVLQLLFEPGFSTRVDVTDVSGRGVGLDVVRANMEKMGGAVAISSEIGRGTEVRLTFPLSLVTTPVLLVRAGGIPVALPISAVLSTADDHANAVVTVVGRSMLRWQGRSIPLAQLADLLRVPATGARGVFLVIEHAGLAAAVRVDQVLGEQELVVKETDPLLATTPFLTGLALLGSGEVCFVLSAPDVIRACQRGSRPIPSSAAKPARASTRRTVLVVEDSQTTREMERQALEDAGYDVLVATDATEALRLVRARSVDAVVADVQLPGMDGYALTRELKADPLYRTRPIILVTSLDSEDARRSGAIAGADAFLTKTHGSDAQFLAALEHLLAA
jgi:chemotaxis protein histidine kinase CheA